MYILYTTSLDDDIEHQNLSCIKKIGQTVFFM